MMYYFVATAALPVATTVVYLCVAVDYWSLCILHLLFHILV